MMTDEELAAFIGIQDHPLEERQAFMDRLSPERRALFERMASLPHEIELWRQGLGPKPTGVLLDFDKARARRARRQ